MKTIIDTDALLGLARPDDPHHEEAETVLMALTKRNADIFLLPTTLSEFSLLATSRVGMITTKQMVGKFLAAPYVILPILEELVAAAYAFYEQQTSKEESLFDCFVMAQAKALFVDCIFSFDRGYRKNGFILAIDAIKNQTDPVV